MVNGGEVVDDLLVVQYKFGRVVHKRGYETV